MKNSLVGLLFAFAAGSAHAYTNAEDAVRGFNICKGFETHTVAQWKARQDKSTTPVRPVEDAPALRPIHAKMDEVLAKQPSAYAHPEDAGHEVFNYCQDNLERLTR